MAEMLERVAKLEERFDGLAYMQNDLRESMRVLETRMDAGFVEVRGELKDIREEMHTQFRWVMGGIGGAVLAILIAMFGLASTFASTWRP
jgi:hypothetical protein